MPTGAASVSSREIGALWDLSCTTQASEPLLGGGVGWDWGQGMQWALGMTEPSGWGLLMGRQGQGPRLGDTLWRVTVLWDGGRTSGGGSWSREPLFQARLPIQLVSNDQPNPVFSCWTVGRHLDDTMKSRAHPAQGSRGTTQVLGLLGQYDEMVFPCGCARE